MELTERQVSPVSHQRSQTTHKMTHLTWAARALPLLALLAAATPARALQPLSEFLAGARKASVDDRQAALVAVQAEAGALVSLGQALPSVSAKGIYTNNQYNVVLPAGILPGFPALTLIPGNQWDALFELDVPIVDLGSWTRIQAARAQARSAHQGERATVLQIEQQVASYYHQLIGAEGLRRSAQRTLEVSEANLELIRDRRQEGITTELDVNRAVAETESARSNIADAELASQVSRRALVTLTGVEPSGDVPSTEDDLHEEASLEGWESSPEDRLPALQAAVAQTEAAELGRRAASFALLPTLSGSINEHFTNATSFVGQPAYYTAMAVLGWRLDLSTIENTRVQSAAAEIARLNEERVRLAARDQIFGAWQRVHADIIKSRASRAQVKAAELASQYARERYLEGAGTQLEVVQAQRDAFAADVARLQADADLSFSRAVLRLAAGQSLDPEPAP
jgi:multidrug efflux system outer membrane protein